MIMTNDRPFQKRSLQRSIRRPHRRLGLPLCSTLLLLCFHPAFPVSILDLPTGASTNGLVQPLSSEKKKRKIVYTNPLILQIFLNQRAVVSLILLTPFPLIIMAIA